MIYFDKDRAHDLAQSTQRRIVGAPAAGEERLKVIKSKYNISCIGDKRDNNWPTIYRDISLTDPSQEPCNQYMKNES